MSTDTAIAPASPEREKLTKKAITADHPTWCPGCGDFAVLAAYYKVLERRNLPHENIVTLAGIGCSSRFPYFVNTHGGDGFFGELLAFGGSGDGEGFGAHLIFRTPSRISRTR